MSKVFIKNVELSDIVVSTCLFRENRKKKVLNIVGQDISLSLIMLSNVSVEVGRYSKEVTEATNCSTCDGVVTDCPH